MQTKISEWSQNTYLVLLAFPMMAASLQARLPRHDAFRKDYYVIPTLPGCSVDQRCLEEDLRAGWILDSKLSTGGENLTQEGVFLSADYDASSSQPNFDSV